MDLADITRLNIYTDVDETLKHFDVLGARFGLVHAAPPMTLLGVTRPTIPGLLFEIEATPPTDLDATQPSVRRVDLLTR